MERKHIIALWKYVENEGNYPGYHITADESGCRLLTERIGCLLEARARDVAVSLVPPTRCILEVPNNKRGEAKCVYFAELRLQRSNSPEEFRIAESTDSCQLVASPSLLARLRDGVEGISQGQGDYSIGVKSAQLWFWWFPS